MVNSNSLVVTSYYRITTDATSQKITATMPTPAAVNPNQRSVVLDSAIINLPITSSVSVVTGNGGVNSAQVAVTSGDGAMSSAFSSKISSYCRRAVSLALSSRR